ncbi:serine/threonine-protein kinase [Polyangium spumosum]|uniref:Protein kinase n=1 Tax=Polyangium spumosum TaxID=889282 RepID=A0A6N7Q971_9BACT|nr:serine/threonine-protein kinase [Polyangium spumosum]MRG97431.1 protein kinase [Polyangium spumosum]
MKVGDVVRGEYKLVRPIGDGAMGAVWETLHEPTGRRVALKLIKSQDEHLRRRLVREARLCGQLRHQNIVELYEAGETEKGDPFLAMELLTGETVAALLQRRHTLSSSLTARIGRDVAYALSVAHEARIVHRDLKPTNIFLHRDRATSDWYVKVLDFGVAKQIDGQDSCLTQTGGVVGSLAYMSPEQLCVAKNLDHRTDIWSIGVVMFEMIVGVRPFGGSTEDLIHAILTEDAPLVSRRVRHVDPGLAEIIAHCLTRDRQKRIGSALELAAMLEACTRGGSLADELGAAPPDSGEATRVMPSKAAPPLDGNRRLTANGTVVLGPEELAANKRQPRAESQPEPTTAVLAATTPLPELPETPPGSSRRGSADGPEEAPPGTSSIDGVVRWVAPPRPGSIPEIIPSAPMAPSASTTPQVRRSVIDIKVATGLLVGALGLLAFAVVRDKASTATPPAIAPAAVAQAPMDVARPGEAQTGAAIPPALEPPTAPAPTVAPIPNTPDPASTPPAKADAHDAPKRDATTVKAKEPGVKVPVPNRGGTPAPPKPKPPQPGAKGPIVKGTKRFIPDSL